MVVIADLLIRDAFASPATEGASAKLRRVLPEPLRDGIQTLEEVVTLEPVTWIVSTPAECLMRVSTAIRLRRRLAFDYQSHDGSHSHRQLEPYGVAHMDGRWYMAGRCLLRQDLRTFRLDRTGRVELCAEVFERPTDFDIKAYLQHVMPFVRSMFTVEVWLDLPFAEAQSRFALHRVRMQEENGGTVLRCGRENLEAFAAMLLSLACRIVVRERQQLKDAFSALAARVAHAAVGSKSE